MIRTGLVLAAILIAVSGSAFADVVLCTNPEPTEGVNRDRLWNPFIGTRPWLEPIGYHVPGRVVTSASATTTTNVVNQPVAHAHEEGWYRCSDHDHTNTRVIHDHHHHGAVRQ